MATRADLARWAGDATSFLLRGDKDHSRSTDVRNELLTSIEGASVADVELVGQTVLPKLVSRVRPESRKLIAMHDEAGRDTWIVSASPIRIVEPLANALGMTGAIATEGEIVDGRFTGRLDGPMIYGEGKVEAIETLAAERGYDLNSSYAYSDSISDLPMLGMVGHPVAVNPDSELARVAHERGWPVVIFARRTKRLFAFSGVMTAATTAAALAYALGRRHGRAARLRLPFR